MCPELHKILDNISHKLPKSFDFIGDILIVTKGNEEDHLNKVEEVLRALNEARIRPHLEKT